MNSTQQTLDFESTEPQRRLFIAPVSYTITDETFWTDETEWEEASRFRADTPEMSKRLLQQDGWRPCGKTNRYNYDIVDMWTRDVDHKYGRLEWLATWEVLE